MESGRSRTAPISQSQKTMLTDFIKTHPKLIKCSFSTTFTHQKAQELWEEIAEKLNSIPGGASKDWKKWRKTWQDLKKLTKSKMVAKKREIGQTGGGPPADIKIDDGIADLIGPTEVDGHIEVPEPNIDFSIDEIKPAKESANTDPFPEFPKPVCETKPRINPNENLILEVDDGGKMGDEKEKENSHTSDHTYNLEYPSGLPKKKINQTQRLATSIKIGQQLLQGVNSRNNVMEEYYIKKMAFMDHQMEHNTKILKAVENNTATLNELLAAIIPKK